ncbi:3-dehydroquinate synthase [Lederbergia sp. NSJ-179]|uniref:3-dehydroquinate synthase n=1 Tax=Lederbergia sp. NSJ-179 TaxID=2931402 RepID=UPI001FD3AFEE|nr:3-dehydroquinate synthase [Lederbergia sp. NSJ-179]MCJ7839462.1 3-dehydroquinate synthase [Lederbergia sp. NSJ-179]
MQLMIQTASKNYPVFIGEDALQQLKAHLQKADYTNILVITDETVGKLHLDQLQTSLPETAACSIYHVPSGEKAKQFSVYEAALTYALEQGLDRKSCILAFGGGSVGDLAGFVAATFMRGIRFVQVPTTILAHDSAVGGKTGINHPLGKNMVGAFHQPEGVFYCIDFLKSLPISEIRSGFAEAIKHAFIADRRFLEFLMDTIDDVTNITERDLSYVLKKGIEIKADIVGQDERENGLRAVLNFGHTLGHAIEATAGYGKVTHGEAIMTGLVYALYLSQSETGLTYDLHAFEQWLKTLGYRLEIPERFDFEKAIVSMRRDKKSVAHKPRFVLLEEIGKPIIKEIEEERLKQVYKTFISTTTLQRRSSQGD